jgi:hypothetical protein
VRRFVSRAIKPEGRELLTAPNGSEPPVPRAFRWDDRTLRIAAVLKSWRGTKTDRGDAYLKRHWFELKTEDGATLEVYYDRAARRGMPQWWLHTIDE